MFLGLLLHVKTYQLDININDVSEIFYTIIIGDALLSSFRGNTTVNIKNVSKMRLAVILAHCVLRADTYLCVHNNYTFLLV